MQFVPKELTHVAPGFRGGLVLPLFTFMLVTALAAAETLPRYATRRFDLHDGLPDLDTPVLRQGTDGFLWIGSASGLVRFDGREFKLLKSPLIGRDLIRCIESAPDGSLWIGTQGGVVRLKHGELERAVPFETAVASLLVDKAGRVWIGTYQRGLWRYEDGRLIDCSVGLRGSAESTVRALFEDSTGRIWVGLGNGGPAYVEGDRVKRLPNMPRAMRGVTRFVESLQNTVWFSSGPAVYRWRGNELTTFGKENGLSGETVWSLAVDREGQIWAAARRLFRLPSPDATAFVAEDVLDADLCHTVTFDTQNGCWVGTSGSGLAYLTRTGFSMLTAGQFGGYKPMTMAFLADGGAYAATREGILRFDASGAPVALDAQARVEDAARSLCLTRDGRLWVGRIGPLEIWTGKERKYADCTGVQAIFEDHTGDVWLGNADTIWRCHEGHFTRMNEALALTEGLPVGAFGETADGLYIGMRRGGLLKYSAGQARMFRADADDALDGIRALQPDRDGNVWIGTRGNGLALFRDGKVWSPPALSRGFAGFVTTIQLDDKGRLFVGTPAGLFWAKRDDAVATALGRNATSPFVLVDASEGIAPAPVGFGAYPSGGRCPDGRLWFATRTGVVMAAPEQLVEAPRSPPPLHILDVEAGDRMLDVSAVVRLPARAAGLRIDYTAVCFDRPELVQFRYRMSGYDTEWIEAGPRRAAYYGHLPPGEHRFELIAAENGGNWTETPAVLSLYQEPRLSETAWFQLAAIAAIAGAGVSVGFAGNRMRLKRRLATLEAEKRLTHERERIARDLHDELGSSITAINLTAQRLKEFRTPASEGLVRTLESRTRRLALELDRVVWSVAPANNSLDRLATFVERFALQLFAESGIACRCARTTEIPAVPLTPESQHHLLAIIKEALNNVLKHSRASQAHVTLEYAGGAFGVSIGDNGLGFAPDARENAGRNGLKNMKTRAAELDANVTIASRPGGGTTVTIHWKCGVPNRPLP